MSILGDEVKEVDSFMIVYKYKDRFTRPFKRTLTMLTKMFGNFWKNVVLVVNFWSFKSVHVEDRRSMGKLTIVVNFCTQNQTSEQQIRLVFLY